MNSPESINSKSNKLLNLIYNNWENLDDSQKSLLTRVWKVLTYKWQLQILFNLPFLIWWGLDKYITKIHEFDMYMLDYLHLPDWLLSFVGFGQ